eukprot:CAMPEP_0202847376 /NCGR_PEP_ID=MMETSP1389-20130828/75217_1 /ASSEMBLY_ACC=CAM_ASM_000865 /TAXON_ID=302021 /ORGANISM="Rhodomonas sp., Strain CCMP768" /LENGTH=127 /DNA_ID=CAMNT_0049525073 /DNA_START=49 /DNA_END=432 /DNA_ORIENTATION=-
MPRALMAPARLMAPFHHRLQKPAEQQRDTAVSATPPRSISFLDPHFKNVLSVGEAVLVCPDSGSEDAEETLHGVGVLVGVAPAHLPPPLVAAPHGVLRPRARSDRQRLRPPVLAMQGLERLDEGTEA